MSAICKQLFDRGINAAMGTRRGVHQKPMYKMPDYEYVHKELQKSGVTLKLLWLEYCEKCRENGELPYQSTQFNKYYSDYAITAKTL